MRLEVIALATLFVFILWLMHRRHRASVKAERAAMFDACLPLMKSYQIVQDNVNFPVLTGIYRGHNFRVEPLADHVGFRKIPSLWLLVTIKGEVPVKGAFDLLVRPQNIEFFSPSSELSENVSLPEGWPAHAMLKTDRPEAMPPLTRLEPHVLAIFADPKAKELVVTPRGVRIVYQLTQVLRSEYLILRALMFEDVSLAPTLLSALLDRAIAVCNDLGLARQHPLERGHEKAA